MLKRSRLFAFNQVNRDAWVAVQAASLAPGLRVLDVGAGSCPYRPLFAHCEYKAQDFQKLQGSQLRHGGYGLIDYVCDAGTIPVPSSSFDAILCTEVLEHIPDPVAQVKEFARILQPGGKLMLTAPLGSGLHQEPHHYYGGFTPFWYRKYLAEAGFENIAVEANGGSFAFFAQESLRFIRMSAPLRLNAGILPRLLWAPIWLCLLPIFAGLVPLAGHWLDRFDHERRFTVGYHVTANKAQSLV